MTAPRSPAAPGTHPGQRRELVPSSGSRRPITGIIVLAIVAWALIASVAVVLWIVIPPLVAPAIRIVFAH